MVLTFYDSLSVSKNYNILILYDLDIIVILKFYLTVSIDNGGRGGLALCTCFYEFQNNWL